MFLTITFIIIIGIFIANMFSGGGSPRAVREMFFGRYYADKGVLSADDKPNTLQSFQNCIDKGIAIKTDVHLAADRKLVVCADNNLSKNYGVDKNTWEASLEELTALGIPTLEELLDLVEGKVPVILELKPGSQNDILCRFTADAFKEYDHGNISIASFHRGLLAWFKTIEKTIFRGIISAPAKSFKALSPVDKFLVGNLANNSVCRPHYVLYREGSESIFVRFAYSLGIVKGVWDVKSKENAKNLEATKDMIVFSGFTPDTCIYKDLPVREKTKLEIETEQRNAEKEAIRIAKVEARLQKKLDKENAKKPEDSKDTSVSNFAAYLEEDKELQEKEQTLNSSEEEY